MKMGLRIGDVVRFESDRMLTIYRGTDLLMLRVEKGHYRVLGFDEHGIDFEKVDSSQLPFVPKVVG